MILHFSRLPPSQRQAAAVAGSDATHARAHTSAASGRGRRRVASRAGAIPRQDGAHRVRGARRARRDRAAAARAARAPARTLLDGDRRRCARRLAHAAVGGGVLEEMAAGQLKRRRARQRSAAYPLAGAQHERRPREHAGGTTLPRARRGRTARACRTTRGALHQRRFVDFAGFAAIARLADAGALPQTSPLLSKSSLTSAEAAAALAQLATLDEDPRRAQDRRRFWAARTARGPGGRTDPAVADRRRRQERRVRGARRGGRGRSLSSGHGDARRESRGAPRSASIRPRRLRR